MDTLERLKNTDIRNIVDKGSEIYENIKNDYEPKQNGKFMAIDIESEDVYVADTSALAVVLAKKDHPENIFFVLKIGYDTAETIANFYR